MAKQGTMIINIWKPVITNFLVRQVTLTAQFPSSVPLVETAWRKNNLPLATDNNHYRERVTQGEASLSIENVETEDNGEYSCTIVTGDTSHTTSCKLTVMGESLL